MKKNLLAVSLITLSCLYGVLAAVVILTFILLQVPVSYGIILSMFIIVLQFFISPILNDWIFKVFYKAKFDYELPQFLNEFIEESCKKHNMNYPRIGFIDDGAPNAFTYGRTKNDARVVITRGVLELLNEEEAKAVVAHELGHANHYDMLFMTAAQLVPLILYYIYDLLIGSSTRRGRSSRSSSNNSNSQDLATMLGMLAYVLYIISQYIILWLSRTREYSADSFSIEETRNPSALASALIKIGFGLATGSKNENSKVSSANTLGISNAKFSKGVAISSYNNGEVSKQNVVNAMKWEKWNVWAKWLELNSTHPLISKRLLAISDRCEEFGQERYIEFNEKKPESFVDDFIREILLISSPYIISIGTLIIYAILALNNNQFVAEGGGFIIWGIAGIIFTLSLFLNLSYTHKNKDYKETTVEELLGEVKVSPVRSIPCILRGRVIGRGNPGCIFNEDFVIQDNTGIMFLNYTQPLYVLEKIFALFKSEENFDKEVVVKGWYRRSTSPYVEIHSFEVDGKTKKCHTYTTTKVVYGILFVLSVVSLVNGLMM